MSGFLAWLQEPYTSGMSAYRWFLFIGLVIVIFTAWGLILKTLEDATS